MSLDQIRSILLGLQILMKIGITGHQRLPDPTDWIWVEKHIQSQLQVAEPLIGISSLAIGADQLFARLVLKEKGRLIAVIPSSTYAESFESPEEKANYESLKNQANEVRVLPDVEDVEESYLRAGHCVVDLCDLLLAVWNGQPAKGKGGTADAIDYARKMNRKVVHINPTLKSVTQL